MMIRHFETNTQLVDRLALGRVVTPSLITTVVVCPIGDVNIDDIVQVNAAFQCTNIYLFDVMVAHFIGLGPYPALGPPYLVAPCGENITPDMHHSIRHMSSARKVTAPVANACVTLNCYATSTLAKTGNYVVVDTGGKCFINGYVISN